MTDAPDDDRTVIKPVTQVQPRPAPAADAHPEAHGNALPVGSYLGEFELTGIVGVGGFGIVYTAWDHSLERRVALKEYMPSSLAQRSGDTQVSVKSERHRDTFEAGLKSFVNEAKLLAQFDHSSLVKVYRFWEANGTAYMVMPVLRGRTLREVRQAPPAELARRQFAFRDARYPELLFRYRARNWPDTLDAAEQARWQAFRRARLEGTSGLGGLNREAYFQTIAALRTDPAAAGKGDLLDALEAWGRAQE